MKTTVYDRIFCDVDSGDLDNCGYWNIYCCQYCPNKPTCKYMKCSFLEKGNDATECDSLIFVEKKILEIL